eukprot:Ihof_evm1s1074 gene=Ihof_evmTU1s1074
MMLSRTITVAFVMSCGLIMFILALRFIMAMMFWNSCYPIPNQPDILACPRPSFMLPNRGSTSILDPSLKRENETTVGKADPNNMGFLAPVPKVIPANGEIVYRDIFEKIYETKVWGEEGRGSGPGSSVEITMTTRANLINIIKKYNINSFLDAPCGGFLWQSVLLDEVATFNPNFHYHGCDVTKSVVDRNIKENIHKSRWSFSHCDITTGLPSGDFDIIFTRAALQHLPHKSVFKYLDMVKKSGIKYILIEGYPFTKTNVDVQGDVGYDELNLRIEPFNLKGQILEDWNEG